MSRQRLSRRRAVQVSGSVLLTGLAGCPADPGGDETTTGTGGTDATTSDPTETGPPTRTTTRATPPTETVETESAEVETDTPTGGDDSTGTRTTTVDADVTPAISVSDQETGGETITVASAAIDRPGWLVVHPAADGGPDAATYLAAVPLDPGRSTDVEMPLNRSLEEDRTLHAMLHYDDPADDNFTFAPGRGDDPPVTSGGETVGESFRVTVT